MGVLYAFNFSEDSAPNLFPRNVQLADCSKDRECPLPSAR